MRFGGVFVGVLVAAGAALFVLQGGGGDEPAQPRTVQQQVAQVQEVKTVDVYVAKEYIPVGTVITEKMFDVQPWPEHLLVPGFAVADGKMEIAGMVTRSTFQPQEPFIRSKLVNASDPSFIAGNLPKGMRVITIETNEIFGLAGFLAAGDRVDVLLDREVQDKVYLDPRERDQTQRFRISETILSNVRVIAVDQKAAATVKQEGLLGVNQPTRYEPPRSVSLMVAPEDARRLRLAENIGTLSLALRSLEDQESEGEKGLTFVSDVSEFVPEEVGITPEEAKAEEEAAAPPPKAQLVTIVRGIEVEDKQTKKRQLDLEDGIASVTGAASRRR